MEPVIILSITMYKRLICCWLIFTPIALWASCPEKELHPDAMFPELVFETSHGNVVVELDRQKAPVTVNHFLHHLDQGLLNDNLVHRVVKDYVIQTAAFKPDLSELKGCGQLINESGNGLKNSKGTLAMARHNDPHSASLSFFFNMSDNSNLDPSNKGWGYAVFGYVTEGMDVLEKINQTPVEYNAQLDAPNVPVTPVIIKKVSLRQ